MGVYGSSDANVDDEEELVLLPHHPRPLAAPPWMLLPLPLALGKES